MTINSVSDVNFAFSDVRRSINEAKTLRALNVQNRRARRIVKQSSGRGLKSEITKTAKSEFRETNRLINQRKKDI